jgi:threonine dehydrogenase-like Zn-dependent dehydrogenase
MRAFRFHRSGIPLSLEEIPLPKVDDDGVLIRVRASGICGTDLHYRHGTFAPGRVPITNGHECAGIVEKVGSSVKDLVEGDRVLIHYVISCGACINCNSGQDNKCLSYTSFGHHVDGGFAEYAVVPARNAFRLPKEIPFEQGAVMGCAVPTAFHALRIAETAPGDNVVVFGLGGVGMNIVQCAKLFGASRIIGVDVLESKLRLARELGADETIDARNRDPLKAIVDMTDGLGAEVTFECAGMPKTVQWALKSVRGRYPFSTNGRVVQVAALFDTISLAPGAFGSEGGLRFSGDHTRDDLRRVIGLVHYGRIDVGRIVSHKIPFAEINKGIDLLDSHSENVMRIVAIQ